MSPPIVMDEATLLKGLDLIDEAIGETAEGVGILITPEMAHGTHGRHGNAASPHWAATNGVAALERRESVAGLEATWSNLKAVPAFRVFRVFRGPNLCTESPA